jgi:hypothetical protein
MASAIAVGDTGAGGAVGKDTEGRDPGFTDPGERGSGASWEEGNRLGTNGVGDGTWFCVVAVETVRGVVAIVANGSGRPETKPGSRALAMVGCNNPGTVGTGTSAVGLTTGLEKGREFVGWIGTGALSVPVCGAFACGFSRLLEQLNRRNVIPIPSAHDCRSMTATPCHRFKRFCAERVCW